MEKSLLLPFFLLFLTFNSHINMKKYLTILSIFLSFTFLNAQKQFSISLGTAGTSRILTPNKTGLTINEGLELKSLEVPKPSFRAEIAYSKELDEKKFLRLGVGFQHIRFGTKRFTLPSGVINPTPQYGVRKQVVMQNQEFVFVELNFSKIKFSKTSGFFIKTTFIHNHPFLSIYEPIYYPDGNTAFVGRRRSETLKAPRIDFNLSFGLNYKIFSFSNAELILQPYISANLRSYRIAGVYNEYLYFFKDTEGYLWDFGMLVQYKFKRKKS